MGSLEQKAQILPRTRRRSEIWLIPAQIGILAALLVLWQVSVSSQNLMFFSRPTLVAQRLYELFVGGEIYRHIVVHDRGADRLWSWRLARPRARFHPRTQQNPLEIVSAVH